MMRREPRRLRKPWMLYGHVVSPRALVGVTVPEQCFQSPFPIILRQAAVCAVCNGKFLTYHQGVKSLAGIAYYIKHPLCLLETKESFQHESAHYIN